MYDAQTITAQNSTATDIYSPWFPRGGDYGLFTLEVAAINGPTTTTLTVTMVQKNRDDTGDGTEFAGLSIARTSAGRTTVDFSLGGGSPAFAGFDELVRYKFSLQGGSTGTSWATFRMLSPVWYDTV